MSAANNGNTVSGYIEADEYKVTSELSGRIGNILVDEGARVKIGQVLVELDHALLDAQIAQAQAAVKTAQAQRALIEKSARSSDVAAAQAALKAAQEAYAQVAAGAKASDLAAAQAALKAAQENYDKLLAGPKASDLAAAQAALKAAQEAYAQVRKGPSVEDLAPLKAQVDNAKAALDQAQAAYDKIGGASNPNIALTPQARALEQATNNYTAALAAYNNALSHPTAAELAAAKAQVDNAQAALARLTPDEAQLAAAKAQVDNAQATLNRLVPDAAQLAAAQAQVDNAQAVLNRLTPTEETLAVAQAQVQQAQAALEVLNVHLAKTKIVAPSDGIISRRAANPGELATPGTALLTLSHLDPVELTVYVPETRLGAIQLGSKIPVQVDSFPDRAFEGTVIYISDQAEFTPRNVQTREERVNTVFAVKLQIPNSALELKPGMPADATLQ
ncbi:MAG: efflux RND transporter periplasmic adaptor subunit [Chloroflexi bacterium]|nr:efflux RND transporter periplasmic adaptor subunit [Chloroflexota bacterium]